MVERLDDQSEWAAVTIRIPPELARLGTGPDFQRFFDAMAYKMRRNAHKGRWETVPLTLAMKRLVDEVHELAFALAQGSTSEILMEAADVANMALIVANIALEARGI